MTTKLLIFRILAVVVLMSAPLAVAAQEIEQAVARETEQSRYERMVERYTTRWQRRIPRYTKMHFAGSMGLLSAGIGWDYGKDKWETDLFLGIVPQYAASGVMPSFTIKQNYFPWKLDLGERVSVEPFSCGMYINTLLHRDFWRTQPDKYPKGYYWFSTRIRLHGYVGQRINFNFRSGRSMHKSVSFYYEVSACDLYVLNRVGNKYLTPKDYLSLGFGVKWQIL